MSQTLLTGASGLLTHQRKLDIVANNLANLNTMGYKAQRILFSDLLYTTIQPAAAGDNVQFGGTNPRQAGFGVSVAQTSRSHGQGVLTASGQAFDMAIEGSGFFVLNDGAPVYTRGGAFSLDTSGYLVDPATGAFVQRYGDLGEGLDGNPQFQTPGDMSIQVPLGVGIAGRQTTVGSFLGNLPATAIPPLAEVLSSATPLQAGGVAATTTTLINDLDSNNIDYISGDQLEISGTDVDGTAFSTMFSVDGTTTVGDLVAAINAELTGATATLDVTDGSIIVTANDEGEAMLSLLIADTVGSTGRTNFSDHAFLIETDGKEGDVVESTIQVFDLRGEAHDINASFQKIDANTWDAKFELVDAAGQLLDSEVASIEFTEAGAFRTVNGVGLMDSNIELKFDNLTQPQQISMSFDNLTHLATSYSMTFDQDGFAPGNLAQVSISQDGIINGIATNGQKIPIAQVAIATFINVQGLQASGQNYYVGTANSGQANLGPGMSGAAGAIRGGQLESSNVDIALEFTQLIVAQRGFSANARTITVANEVLEEMTSIVR